MSRTFRTCKTWQLANVFTVPAIKTVTIDSLKWGFTLIYDTIFFKIFIRKYLKISDVIRQTWFFFLGGGGQIIFYDYVIVKLCQRRDLILKKSTNHLNFINYQGICVFSSTHVVSATVIVLIFKKAVSWPIQMKLKSNVFWLI